jgi:3-phosphoshikimate 1-carboxyvinyltransferase
MGRVLTPLKTMGLAVEDADRTTLPLALRGTPDLIPIVYTLPVASAQVKSAVLLAGLHAPGRTTVIEQAPTRDHTERMLAQFGAETCIEDRADGIRAISVSGDAELTGVPVSIPADPSSAAFAIAAALLTKGSDIVVDCVSMNPTRTGFIETLREMGADIELLDLREQGGEPVGDLRVRASALKAIDLPPERAPSMIDEYPVLAAVAALAEGESSLRGLSELKVKESDRLAATAEGLTACGVEARVEGDDLIVVGRETVEGGAVVSTHMDHRIAMAFLVLGLAADKPVTVDDASMIATSFPEFVPLMTKLGASFA